MSAPDVTLWTTWSVQRLENEDNGGFWRDQLAWHFESKMAALKTIQGAKRNGLKVRLVRVLHEVVS